MNSKLIVNGYELDLSQDIAVPLNLSITDIKEPEKRKRSFSKTLTLEGTSNNMAFFIAAYSLDVNIEESTNIQFKPNLRYDCEFFKNDLRIFKGKFKLNEVKILNGNYSFDCNLISEAVDVFAKLKDKKLNELNWSEYDHTLTRDNVIKSWSEGVYVNTVLTRNFGADTRGYQPKSYGYIYPLVDYGYNMPANSPLNFRINQLYPFIYVKEAIKKCLDFALEDTNIVVDYTTSFFTSKNMQKLIYGFGGGEQIKLNADLINKLKVDFTGYTNTTGYAGSKNGSGSSAFYSTNKLNDVIKIYIQNTLTQDINKLNKTAGTITINGNAIYSTRVYGSFTLNNYIDVQTSLTSRLKFYIEVNGVLKTQQNINISTDGTYTFDLKSDISLKTGDIVKIYVQVIANNKNSNFTLTFNSLNATFEPNKESPLTDGSILTLSTAIPDIKCSEFLKGILNLFYSYMSDPIYDPVTNKSTIYIDSFFNFYQDQNIYDNWTDLVDESKDITIQSNSLVEGNIYQYTFSEEKDFLNTKYRDLVGINYGEKQIEIDTWLNGVVKFELPFNTYVPYKIENSLLIYPMVKEEIIYSKNGTSIKPYKGKGMLTFYNGLRSGVVNIYNAEGSATGDWQIKYDFPLIHHFRFKDENTYVPLFDLHFAPRNAMFDDLKNAPSANTFNIYHEKFLNEITSIDSKLVTLYLKLTYKDINELDFSKLKMIDGVLYRLNTIKDFDSDAYGTTEVELIKYLG